jgi:hypothetical protein
LDGELLALLFEAKRPLRPSELYDDLAQRCGVSEELRKRKRPGRSETIWRNNVQWARMRLVKRGLISRDKPGVWELTPAAYEQLRDGN